jgi:hypothetical protein
MPKVRGADAPRKAHHILDARMIGVAVGLSLRRGQRQPADFVILIDAPGLFQRLGLLRHGAKRRIGLLPALGCKRARDRWRNSAP